MPANLETGSAPRTSRGSPTTPTGRPRLDEMVEQLADGGRAFARWPLERKAALARDMQAGILQCAEAIVQAGASAKGLPERGPLLGEEWATGPWVVVRQLRLVAEALTELALRGTTPLGAARRSDSGRLVASIFPTNRVDAVLFAGISADVWFQAEVNEQSLADRGAAHRSLRDYPGTALVLGAGNLAGIPAADVITKLFNEGRSCLLKLNPINSYLGPILERAFAAAIRENVLRIAYGGTEEGAYLVEHPGIAQIHLTGSDRTYNQMVWGAPGPDRDHRMALNRPLVTKPMTAELGNVSPVLFVPGPFTARELAFQARSIAGAMTLNGGFNCCTPRMLVTPRQWNGRANLLEALGRALGQAPLRPAYYPGGREQWGRLTGGRREAQFFGRPGAGELPWTLLAGLDATDPREPAFLGEHFCPVLFETEVGSDDPIEFLDRAVDFVNNRLWGTLCVDLVVHPSLFRDPVTRKAVERAIDRLRYGIVAVNSWSGFMFVYGGPPWGAAPGASPQEIQSGMGWVHNTSMLEGIEKVVLRHPITLTPKPATFPGHRTADTLMRRLTRLDADAAWRHVPGVVAAAIRG